MKPKDSIVIKEGELYKVGRRTKTLQSRYYVLRDSTLFIYENRFSLVPQDLIYLRGMYVRRLHQSSYEHTDCYGFCIYHNQKDHKNRYLYHRNKDVANEWFQLLKEHACNLNFDNFYSRGKRLGSGKFSNVYQCQVKESNEIVAVKMINKQVLQPRDKNFLRDEVQIVKLISHPYIVQMRETYESENSLYIVMDQVEGGELFDHIR